MDRIKEELKENKAIEGDLDTKTVVQGQKYQIDLGSVITIEQKLWSILE